MVVSWKRSKDGYGLLSVSLHWLMLLLIVATYATMNLKSIYLKGSHEREVLAFWHYSLGLTVFGFVWFRLLARCMGRSPVIRPALPIGQAIMAKVVQFLLYGLMIGLPVLGWLTLSAKGVPVPFFNLELPVLITADHDYARLFKKIHESIATVGYFLIGLHALAALFHHFVKRDNTMKLMMSYRGHREFDFH